MNIVLKLGIFLGIGFVTLVLYVVWLFLQRQRNIKKAEGHIWVQVISKAKQELNYLVKVVLEGGIAFVRIPDTTGKVTESSPTHILGEEGEFTAVYPPGKPKFVQVLMPKIGFQEGNAEPITNFSGRPIISAQLIANLNNGVATASAETMRKSWEESTGEKLKKGQGLLWVYVGLVTILGLGVASVILLAQQGTTFSDLAGLIKTAMGIK